MEQRIFETIETLRESINRVFIGREDVVEDLLVCLMAGGHVLLEDVPGVGKTSLAGVLAKTTSCSFGRIQFTPDTLPGDVSGISVYNMKTGAFEYREGVVMNQILLADEINRTSPKTQASLLEAMAEGQVTVDGVVHALPEPFMVIATQNPVEFLGTYPLPEAQMDRFMMRLSIGYPEREQEIRMAQAHLKGDTPDSARAVCGPEDILQLREAAAAVSVSDALLDYMKDIVDLTRQEERFMLGASPRAFLALIRASQGNALLMGRDFVKPDDVKAVVMQVLLHRLALSTDARLQKEDAAAVLKSLVLNAKIPIEMDRIEYGNEKEREEKREKEWEEGRSQPSDKTAKVGIARVVAAFSGGNQLLRGSGQLRLLFWVDACTGGVGGLSSGGLSPV